MKSVSLLFKRERLIIAETRSERSRLKNSRLLLNGFALFIHFVKWKVDISQKGLKYVSLHYSIV